MTLANQYSCIQVVDGVVSQRCTFHVTQLFQSLVTESMRTERSCRVWSIIMHLLHYYFIFIFSLYNIIECQPFFFFFPFPFILQILSSVFACLLLGGEREKNAPNGKQANKTKNFVGKILTGFIMSQYFQFTLQISCSPGGINTAY